MPPSNKEIAGKIAEQLFLFGLPTIIIVTIAVQFFFYIASPNVSYLKETLALVVLCSMTVSGGVIFFVLGAEYVPLNRMRITKNRVLDLLSYLVGLPLMILPMASIEAVCSVSKRNHFDYPQNCTFMSMLQWVIGGWMFWFLAGFVICVVVYITYYSSRFVFKSNRR